MAVHRTSALLFAAVLVGAIPAPVEAQRRTHLQQIALENAYRHHSSSRLTAELDMAFRMLNEQRTRDGLKKLQLLLDLPFDSNLNPTQTIKPTGLRRQVLKRLNESSIETRRVYDDLFETEARILLERYEKEGRTELLYEVVRRFFHTPSGMDAADLLATLMLDRGESDLAARLWTRIVVDARHRRRLSATSSAKIVSAFQLAGLDQMAQSLVKAKRLEEVILGGRPEPREFWMSQTDSISQIVAGDWNLAFGSRANNASATASIPHLNPNWTYATSPENSDDARQYVRQYISENTGSSRSRPIAASNFAIEHRGAIVVKTLERLEGLDPVSGKPIWHYNSVSNFNRAIREVKARRNQQVSTEIDRGFLWNSVVGLPASDHQRVYTIDYVDLRAKGLSTITTQDKELGIGNRLVALRPPVSGKDVEVTPEWIIGGRIGVPDWFEQLDRDRDSTLGLMEMEQASSAIRELDADGNGILTAAEAGAATSQNPPLAGHYFLGPPLPIDQVLYVVSEEDRQLNLSAIESHTGSVLWTQGIGFVRRGVEADSWRSLLACTPTYHAGMLICATRENILVAVDAITGDLLWSQAYTDENPNQPAYNRRIFARLSTGHPGYIDLPMVDENTIVFMPQFSQFIHAFDAQTGTPRWRVERDNPHNTGMGDNGDEYVATIYKGTILIVGNRYCRGLDLQNGEEIWALSPGRPSGRGFRSDSRYYVPIDDGQIACIDLENGEQVGFSVNFRTVQQVAVPGDPSAALGNRWRPGNLLPINNQIISVGLDKIVAFPQAQPLLEQLTQDENLETDIDAILLSAQLQLTLGQMDEARERLHGILKRIPTGSEQRRVAEMYRSIIYWQLDNGPHPRTDYLLTELRRLQSTDRDELEYQLRRAREAVIQEQPQELYESLVRLLDMDQFTEVSFGESNLKQSIAAIAHDFVRRASIDWSKDSRQEFERSVAQLWRDIAITNSFSETEYFVSVFGDGVGGVSSRMSLLDNQYSQGNWQQAELSLIDELNCGIPVQEGRAAVRLVLLWDRLGAHDEASKLLDRIQNDYSEITLENGESIAEFLEYFEPTAELQRVIRGRHGPDWNVRHVVARPLSLTELDASVYTTIVGYRSSNFPLPDSYSQFLLDKGTDRRSELHIIDRRAATVTKRIELPSATATGLANELGLAGHMFSVVSQEAEEIEIGVYSMLSGTSSLPIWKHRFDASVGSVRAGPLTARHAIFQCDDRLLVFSSRTGEKLWERGGFSSGGGYITDPYAGVFGDDQVVTFFNDRTNYETFETATGRRLHKGVLAFGRRVRLGRRLLYEGYAGTERRFLIWDPASNSIELDRTVFEPVQGRVFCPVFDNDQNLLALVTDNGAMTIWDIEKAHEVAVLPLENVDWTQVIGINVFKRPGRYFVSFRYQRLNSHLRIQQPIRRPRGQPTGPSALRSVEPLPKGLLDVTVVNGALMSFDAKTGRPLWYRDISGRSVVQSADPGLPFLILVGQARQGRRLSGLEMDLISCETGDPVSQRIKLPQDRLIHIDHDLDASSVTLHGLQSGVRLNYSEGIQRIFQDRDYED